MKLRDDGAASAKWNHHDQVSVKNEFKSGFSMEFADQKAYGGYTYHPLHEAFVRDRWVPDV